MMLLKFRPVENLGVKKGLLTVVKSLSLVLAVLSVSACTSKTEVRRKLRVQQSSPTSQASVQTQSPQAVNPHPNDLMPGGTVNVAPSGSGNYRFRLLSGPGSVNAQGIYTAPTEVSEDVSVWVQIQDVAAGTRNSRVLTIHPSLQVQPGTEFRVQKDASTRVEVTGGLAPYEIGFDESQIQTEILDDETNGTFNFRTQLIGSIQVRVVDQLGNRLVLNIDSRAGLPGTPDERFGARSVVPLEIRRNKSAVDAQNRIYSVGSFVDAEAQLGLFRPQMLISRHNDRGELDMTFGPSNQGYVVVTIDDQVPTSPTHIQIQPDGKVLVGGIFLAEGNRVGCFLVRYVDNDHVVGMDTEFGRRRGVRQIVIPEGRVAIPADMKLAPNGDIYFLMNAFLPSDPTSSEVLLAKLSASGDLDPNFGENGVLKLNIGTGIQIAKSMQIDSQGRIVMTGTTLYTWSNRVTDRKVFLARFLNNGQLDPSFGGFNRDPHGVRNEEITARSRHRVANPTTSGVAIHLYADGKILVLANSNQQLVLHRYLEDGRLDRSFGGPLAGRYGQGLRGRVALDIGSDIDIEPHTLAVKDNGLVSVGYASERLGGYGLAQFAENGRILTELSCSGVTDTVTDIVGKSCDQQGRVAYQLNSSISDRNVSDQMMMLGDDRFVFGGDSLLFGVNQ